MMTSAVLLGACVSGTSVGQLDTDGTTGDGDSTGGDDDSTSDGGDAHPADDDATVGDDGSPLECPDNPGSCRSPLCGDAPCGGPLDALDDDGCPRPRCDGGGTCPDGRVCVNLDDYGECGPSTTSCEPVGDECSCGSTTDCSEGVAYCVPEDVAPALDPACLDAQGQWGDPVTVDTGRGFPVDIEATCVVEDVQIAESVVTTLDCSATADAPPTVVLALPSMGAGDPGAAWAAGQSVTLSHDREPHELGDHVGYLSMRADDGTLLLASELSEESTTDFSGFSPLVVTIDLAYCDPLPDEPNLQHIPALVQIAGPGGDMINLLQGQQSTVMLEDGSVYLVDVRIAEDAASIDDAVDWFGLFARRMP